MFSCNARQAYQKGYNKGFQKGISFYKESNFPSIFNIILSFLTLCVLSITLFYSYKSWKDNRYIEHIIKLNDVYYNFFTKNIGVSENHIPMFITHSALSQHNDLNKAKKYNPDLTKKLNLENTDLNKSNDDLINFYYTELFHQIINSNGSVTSLTSALQNIKFIDSDLDEKIDDLIGNISYLQHNFLMLKKNIKEGILDKKELERALEDFYKDVIENRDKYEDLINNIRHEIN